MFVSWWYLVISGAQVGCSDNVVHVEIAVVVLLEVERLDFECGLIQGLHFIYNRLDPVLVVAAVIVLLLLQCSVVLSNSDASTWSEDWNLEKSGS